MLIASATNPNNGTLDTMGPSEILEVGIAMGVLVPVTLIALLAIYLTRERERKRAAKERQASWPKPPKQAPLDHDIELPPYSKTAATMWDHKPDPDEHLGPAVKLYEAV